MYCERDHYSDCLNCGISFVVTSVYKPSKTCSSSCASALTHTEEADSKRKATSLERFGTEHPFQNEEIKAKIQKSLDNSDRDMRFGSEKFIKNFVQKHGVTNASQLADVKAKKAATSMKNYGVDNPMKSVAVRETFSELLNERYGVPEASYVRMRNYDEWIDLESWLRTQVEKPSVEDVALYFNLGTACVSRRKYKENLHSYFKPSPVSRKENLFEEFIKSNFSDIAYIRNDRSVLGPKQLDFYFPDHKFAVEISPTSTHATDTMAFGGNAQKEKNYHRDKAAACEAAGVELLTIFDWMPWSKVMSMIEHKLKGSQRIYARKCAVKSIVKNSSQLSKDLKNFINDSHVLGFNPRGTTHYTYLTYEDEIVAAAAWGSPRNLSVRSSGNSSQAGVIELIRMCFKPGLAVTGGASKLLKSFVRDFESPLERIVTFSDYDLGWGNIYSTLGFDLVQKPQAQLNYAHPLLITESGSDTMSMRVKNTSLHLAGADRLLSSVPGYVPIGMVCVCEEITHVDASCLPSNVEIVKSYGFLSIWDCGYKKWSLNVVS